MKEKIAQQSTENVALTPEQRQRFLKAAEGPLRVRREILRLAATAAVHPKHPHGDDCVECGLKWPCPTVMRYARPSLDAFADCGDQRSWDGESSDG